MITASVMIVEDERVVALHLKQQLTRLGYSVPAIATSGEKALRQIRDLHPDVVLMDIHIDGQMDGIATAAQIPIDLQIPVIYLTAYSEESTLDRACGTRPYGYLIKPFSERELHATLQMVLERRRADVAVRQKEHRLEQLMAQCTADLVSVGRDLKEETTLRIQAEHERHEMQKMESIGQLAGGVAHDFNNLLNVIMGSLDRILRQPGAPTADVLHAAATALKSARSAATLTHRLLAFSRRQPLDPRPMNLNDLVGSMADMLQRMLGETVVLQTRLAGDLWWTSADANQLESAMLNLAVNARDAMPGGGRLTIETANVSVDEEYCAANKDMSPGEYAVVAVSDDGTGMSRELVKNAFEPFFTTKHRGQGTGLGLSQVYGFLKQSGGHVRIYSQLRAGTTVTLYLPRFKGNSSESGQSAPDIAIAASTHAETVLVVEDDDDVRANAIGNLLELGYRVIDAADATAALSLLLKDPSISLLFTDVGLPGLNGRQLADEARRVRPELRILFTSGYAHDALVHQGRLDPGVELLAKPFTFNDLAARIRRALDAPAHA